jgi:uncharacterized protein
MAGLTKAEIRLLSRHYNLPTADIPAQPCLSSRIPHGTEVTREALAMIERAEENVRARGFNIFRVRYLAPSGARVQIAPEEMQRLAGLRDQVCQGLRQVGFGVVEIDPKGNAVSLNEATYLLRAQGHRLRSGRSKSAATE